MREVITRTRRSPGGRDEYGDLIESTAETAQITARAVAPGSSHPYAEHVRDGETVAFTLYFAHGVDIADGDELEIRGHTYKARTAEWYSAFGTARRATVIEATREDG